MKQSRVRKTLREGWLNVLYKLKPENKALIEAIKGMLRLNQES